MLSFFQKIKRNYFYDPSIKGVAYFSGTPIKHKFSDLDNYFLGLKEVIRKSVLQETPKTMIRFHSC